MSKTSLTMGIGAHAKITLINHSDGHKTAIKSPRDNCEQKFKERINIEKLILEEYADLNVTPKVLNSNTRKYEFSMTAYSLNLEDFMKKHRRFLSEDDVKLISSRIIEILTLIETNSQKTNYKNLLHNDIKPSNFLINFNINGNIVEIMEIVICDFSICSFDGMSNDYKIDYSILNNYEFTSEEIFISKIEPTKKHNIYSILKMLDYVIAESEVEFDIDVWKEYNESKINTFLDLMNIFSEYLNKSWKKIQILRTDNIIDDMKEFGIENVISQLNYDEENRILKNIEDKKNVTEFLIYLKENYKKIFFFPTYDFPLKIFKEVFYNVRYNADEKKQAFDEIIYIANNKNHWKAKEVIYGICESIETETFDDDVIYKVKEYCAK